MKYPADPPKGNRELFTALGAPASRRQAFGSTLYCGKAAVGRASSRAVRSVQLANACVACVTAPPARSEAATIVASTSSASVAPAFRALLLWISMQYGH